MKKVNQVIEFPVATYYPAEYLDLVQKFYGDQKKFEATLYCRCSYTGSLNVNNFKEAVAKILSLCPILTSKLVMKKQHGIWSVDKKVSLDRILHIVNHKADLEKAMAEILNPLNSPQFKVYVLTQGNKTQMVFSISHCIADGASFIKILESIFYLYNRIHNHQPAFLSRSIDRSRNPIEIYKSLSAKQKFKLFFSLPPIQKNSVGGDFYGNIAEKIPVHFHFKIPEKTYGMFTQLAKHFDATVFQLLTTAFAITLHKVLHINGNLKILAAKSIRNMDEITSISNASAMFPVYLHSKNLCKDFPYILHKIVKQIRRNRKVAFQRYHMLRKIYNSFYKVFVPTNWVKKSKIDDAFSITYLPMLKIKNLTPINNTLVDIQLLAPLKHKPYFQIAISQTDNYMYLSSSFYGSQADITKVKKFYEKMLLEINDATQKLFQHY